MQHGIIRAFCLPGGLFKFLSAWGDRQWEKRHICHLEVCQLETFAAMRKTSYDILLYLLFRFSFTWHLYFNLKHLIVNICYILWPELIAWPKCLSVWFFTNIWACHLETSTAMKQTSNKILLYLLNPSFSYDIILIEAPFPPIFHCLMFRAKCRCLFMWLYLIC